MLTVTFSTGSPVSAAAISREPPGFCVGAHTVQRVGRDVRRRVHRLHARVLEVRDLVDRLDGLPAGGERRLGVAVVPGHQARLAGGGLVLLRDPRAR